MIHETILERLNFRGVSQSEICKELGLTVQNFNSFLKGKRGIPYTSLNQILAYLGLNYTDGTSVVEPERVNVLMKQKAVEKYGKVSKYAEESGLSGSTVSSVFTGKRKPTAITLEKMLPKLGIALTTDALSEPLA